jgi:hypothetical protein
MTVDNNRKKWEAPTLAEIRVSAEGGGLSAPPTPPATQRKGVTGDVHTRTLNTSPDTELQIESVEARLKE